MIKKHRITVVLILLLVILALLVSGCGKSGLLYVHFQDGSQRIVQDWSFYYRYASYDSPTCTSEGFFPIGTKLTDDLHVQDVQANELIILHDQIKSIRYEYMEEYASFAMWVTVTLDSGEELLFYPEPSTPPEGMAVFEHPDGFLLPLDSFLTDDNCVIDSGKEFGIKGIDWEDPDDEVFIDLSVSMLFGALFDPYRIDVIEFK